MVNGLLGPEEKDDDDMLPEGMEVDADIETSDAGMTFGNRILKLLGFERVLDRRMYSENLERMLEQGRIIEAWSFAQYHRLGISKRQLISIGDFCRSELELSIAAGASVQSTSIWLQRAFFAYDRANNAEGLHKLEKIMLDNGQPLLAKVLRESAETVL